MRLLLFWKENCPKCPAAKKVVAEFEKRHPGAVSYLDVESLDGTVEARIFNVQATPTTIVIDENKKEVFDDEKVVQDWRGIPPDINRLEAIFSS